MKQLFFLLASLIIYSQAVDTRVNDCLTIAATDTGGSSSTTAITSLNGWQ